MDKKIEIYQLAPVPGALMHSYLIKTPNGKLVMMDGGNEERYMEKAYLSTAIRALLGIGEKDYFEIEAWFLTHGHDDHYGEMSMMLKEYDKYSNYKINNIYFDFPDFINSPWKDYNLSSLNNLKDRLDNYAKINGIDCGGKRYYDLLNGAVINSKSVEDGLTITIDGVNFEILQTYDETDDQVNGNSLVIRVQDCNKKSKTCLFLGDASVVSGERLLKKYGKKLKSDIVQLAHHGQAGVDKPVYDAVDAELRLWPIPNWVWNDRTRFKTEETRRWFNIDLENVGKSDFISCLYEKYPENYLSIDSWKECLDGMKIVLEIKE
jgi:glyoxylase-like metal-dependent hydrolase (beta-lactamase superfamily II)